MGEPSQRSGGCRQEPRISAAAGGRDSSKTCSSYNAGMTVFSYLVGGILVWSLIGLTLDNVFTTQWMVLAGALLGALGGIYLAFAPRFRGQPVEDDAAGTADAAQGNGGHRGGEQLSHQESPIAARGRSTGGKTQTDQNSHSREETR